MQSETRVICDLCCKPVASNEGTSVHSEYQGRTLQFTFHNRHADDCISKYLADLRTMHELAH
jgi:hypothetical protein